MYKTFRLLGIVVGVQLTRESSINAAITLQMLYLSFFNFLQLLTFAPLPVIQYSIKEVFAFIVLITRIDHVKRGSLETPKN